MPVPTLERIALEVLACSPQPYWQLQKRRMQLLPEHVANTLVQLLLLFQRLQSPNQLDAFRDCLTTLCMIGGGGGGAAAAPNLDAEWLAHICSLRHLDTLVLRGMPRLKDKALLASLPGLAATLTHLDLSGCSGLTNKCVQVVGRLKGLRALVLTGTSVKSPLLGQLTSLQHLTRLHLGGCDITDADITQHLTAFSNTLQDLELWGSAVGDASAQHIAHTLPRLCRLSLAWTQVSCVLPLLPGLTWLDLSHCRLHGPYGDADFVAATRMTQLRVVLLAETEVDAMGCELLEVVLRSSAHTLRALELTKASLASQLPLLLALESATQLTALSLSGTRLSDDYLPALSVCTALQTLNISLNPEITATGLSATLSGFKEQLERLDLRGTGVGNSVLPMLKHLPRLQQLVLAATDVTWESTAAGEAAAAHDDGVGGVGVGHQQQQQHQAFAPAGVFAAQSACRGPGAPAAGWPSLQMLNASGTQLSDAGCLQLAADMTAAAAAAAASASCAVCSSGSDGDSSSWGLRVLTIGSRSSKLGRKALAALGQVTSLQQLTLVGWELTDRDLLRHLQPLKHLQQLRIKGIDPWLLSDDALLQLASPEQLPQLSCITRDERQLLLTQPSLTLPPAGPADLLSESSYDGATASSSSYSSSHRRASAVTDADTSNVGSMWPSGLLPGEVMQQQQQLAVVTVPWLLQYLPQPSLSISGTQSASKKVGTAAHSPSQAGGGSHSSSKHPRVCGGGDSRGHNQLSGSSPGGSSSPAAYANRRRSSSASGGGGGGGGTVYQRLAAFDERYRYTTDELLALRGGQQSVRSPAAQGSTSNDAAGGQEAPAVDVDVVGGSSASHVFSTTELEISRLLPPEVQAGSRW